MIRVYTPAELAALCRDMHPTLGMQARGLLLLAGNDEPEPCSSCIGTGIGNPHVEGSRCSACNGRGYIRPSPAPSDEEPWAWNHFDPEPGDDTDEVAFIAGDRAYNVGKGERLARENDRRALEIQLNGAGRV